MHDSGYRFYGYWRSSATYRVRILFALKGLNYAYTPVNLLKNEQRSPEYLAVNPLGLVPTLIAPPGATLTQSLAIAEYPALLPADPVMRARARAIASVIACEAQPLQNLRVQKYLREDAGLDDAGVQAWLDRFVGGAMRAAEAMLEESAGDFCVGNTPGLADAFLAPQVYAAQRFKVDLAGLDRLISIYERCAAHPAFVKAHPDNQPDAPAS